jgi:hypothetical protein
MAERRVEVRPFGVRYTCDACGQGEMMALAGTQAIVQEAGKVLVRHVCNVCRSMASFPEKYPTVRYEDVAPVQQFYQPPQQQQPQQQMYQPPQQQVPPQAAYQQPQQAGQQPAGTQVIMQQPHNGT